MNRFGSQLELDLVSGVYRTADEKTFVEYLKNSMVRDIIAYGKRIESASAIPIYYNILRKHTDLIPYELTKTVKSNGQERYQVINRNAWSSNAFHSIGIAHREGIKAYQEPKIKGKGLTNVFEAVVSV